MAEDGNKRAKRGADVQLTKDNADENDENDDSQVITDGFAKADSETLKRRRIVKVKRPESSGVSLPTAPPAAATKQETEAPTAPAATGTKRIKVSSDEPGKPSLFANVDLTAGAVATTTKPTFTFGSVAAKTEDEQLDAKDTAELSSPSPGKPLGFTFGSSTGSSTFGSSTAFKGFGSVAAGGTSTFGGFGSTSSSNNGETSSSFAFSFAQKKEGDETTANTDNVDFETKDTGVLPESYVISNGEEDEECLLEIRCKSYQFGPSTSVTAATEDDTTKAAPSVPPSGSLFASSTPSEDKKDDTAESKGDANDTTDSSKDQGGGVKMWHEVCVGPLRLLQHKDNKRLRLVHRRKHAPNEPTTNVLLNKRVEPPNDVILNSGSEKQVRLGLLTFKFANPADAKSFLTALQSAQDVQKEYEAAEERDTTTVSTPSKNDAEATNSATTPASDAGETLESTKDESSTPAT